ncbi:DUF1349 domain-containing protein [Dysgonomonas macrotermitis]|uniref:DUF1349 domain-containing protein n=1 Tax=Dysgonomonas macrotermitis TaxID=1346286 RepID=A0A1M4Y3Y7_9BACT|nr:DUF1349 domain-containing protein [Dysgonomonas macrotermitis]SHF00380.1 hypothetical protein SAMN05444362_10364 [Dysgonomonas macrotermitis]
MKKILFFFLILSQSTLFSSAQTLSNDVKMEGIPHKISWINRPLSYEVLGNTFVLTGDKGSRLFTDPQQKEIVDTAPIALFKPDGKFQFYCKVKVDFKSVFDAGVLVVYSNSNLWAKLCFEYTPQFKYQVVSVVNKKYSDDNNHAFIEKDEVYLRISGLGGGAYAFHYSLDGSYWNMVRYFYLGTDDSLKIGFLSQSPRGESCKTVFSEVKYSTTYLDDIRGGK